MVHLRELQTFLYKRIAVAGGEVPGRRGEPESAPPALGAVIRSEAGLDASERIEIYANAYLRRLLECLKEDFPAVFAVIGERAFEETARGYLVEYPPAEPSIDWAGRHFASFLREHSILARSPFLADLARLEWAISEVFVAPNCQVLSEEELRTIPPDRWPALILRTCPASQILECGWRISGIRAAVESGENWIDPARQPTAILVWRRAGQVYFRELETAEYAAINAASKGVSFAALCETLAGSAGDDNPAQAINRIFASWIADGLLISPAAAASSKVRAPGKAPRRQKAKR